MGLIICIMPYALLLHPSSRLMLLVPAQVHPHQVPWSSAYARHNRGHADHFQGRWLGLSQGGQQLPILLARQKLALPLRPCSCTAACQVQQQEHMQACVPQRSRSSAAHGDLHQLSCAAAARPEHPCHAGP